MELNEGFACVGSGVWKNGCRTAVHKHTEGNVVELTDRSF